jgi:hypothetical protein
MTGMSGYRLPEFQGFDEFFEYDRWQGPRLRRAGRSGPSASSLLRIRATLRVAAATLGLTRGELARKLEEVGFSNGYARLAGWEQGSTLTKRFEDRVLGLHPHIECCYRSPLWRLLDPSPLGIPTLKSLLGDWLSSKDRGGQLLFTLGDDAAWIRRARRDIRKTHGCVDYPLALRVFRMSHPRLVELSSRSFAMPDADLLYWRGDLPAFIAVLALVREAQANGWDQLAAWRSTFLVRMLPLAARSLWLKQDAFDFFLLARLIVCGERLRSGRVDVNVPVAMRLVEEPTKTPSVGELLGAFDKATSTLPMFDEEKGAQSALVCLCDGAPPVRAWKLELHYQLMKTLNRVPGQLLYRQTLARVRRGAAFEPSRAG